MPSSFKFDKLAFTLLRATCYQRTFQEFTESDYASWGIINENGELTNAGALLADFSPIRHSRIFCTRWNGLNKASGLQDALDDAEHSGSLITLLHEAIAFVARNSKKGWIKLPDGRQELPEYPERAVLEACVNAIIHRDYEELGSEVHIDMFDDRVEIFSPGGMMDGSLVQNLDLMNVASRRRNPIIADIFNRLKFMERRGSGFKKIIEDYQVYEEVSNGAKPSFKSERTSFFITLPNLQYVVSKANDTPNDTPKLTDRQRKILSLIKADMQISTQAIASAMEISIITVKRELKIMRIVWIGHNKTGHWDIE